MSEYFVWTTRTKATKKQAREINRLVKEIDETMDFIGPVSIPGNETHGWLERPNDGTNDYAFRRDDNNLCVAVAKKILGKN